MSESDSETFDNSSLPDTGNYSEYLEVKYFLFFISGRRDSPLGLHKY